MATADVGNLRTRLSWEGDDAKRSMAGFRQDLKALRAEMNLARSGGNDYTKSLKGMRDQSDILTRRLKTQQEQVKLLKERYEESRRVNGENATQTKNLADQYNNAQAAANRTENQLKALNTEIAKQENGFFRLGTQLEGVGDKLQKVGSKATDFGKKYSMRVTAPILAMATASIKVAADFEEAMSKVQAISGATGEELEKLRNQAREMGETTRFSATEAASAQEFLAMAGFETNQILGAMPGLLDLAAASSMDLGNAADITSNIMSAFNLEAEEAGRVADVLAKGASTANTNVEQLGGAMKYVAPIGSSLGLEIEELTAAIGFMSDAGIQGEQAGRQLRQGLLRLASPTGAAADLIEDLSINVFDADGNMKDLDKVVGELSRGLDGMDSKTRAAALSTLFGAESTAGWTVLLDKGEDALKEYTGELENAEGAAKSMADIMNDNTNGALREFQSSLEGLGITVGEHLLPVFTTMVEKATDLTRRFGELDEEQQEQIVKWGLMIAALGPAAIAFGGVANGIGGVLKVGGSLSTLLGEVGGTALLGKLGGLGMAGPVGLAVAGVAGLTYGVFKLSDAMRDSSKVNLEKIETMQSELQATDDLISRFDELQKKNTLTTDEMLRYMDVLALLQQTNAPDKIKKLTDEQNDLLEKSGLTNEEMEEFLGLNDEVILKAPDTAKAISSQGEAYAENTLALKEYSREQRNILEAEVQQQLNDAINEHAQTQRDLNKLIAEAKELDRDRIANQEQQKENMQEQTKQQKVIRDIEQQINDLLDAKDPKNYLEIERLQTKLALEQDTLNEMKYQETSLDDQAKLLTDKYIKNQENLDKTREELAELDNVRFKYEEIILSQLDLNYEKGQGLIAVENQIDALTKEKEQLDKLKYSGELNTLEYQEQVNKINEQISKLQTAKGELQNINEVAGRTIYQSRVVNVKFHARYSGFKTGDSANIGLVGGGGYQSYAKGTDYHPGGRFLAGEEGYELGRLGNRWEILDYGMYNRPSGYQVFTHDETKSILKALNRIPGYATGARPSGEANRVIDSLNNTSQMTGEAVIYTTVINQMDGRELSRHTYKHITEMQNRDKKVRERFAT
jgi:TP901 family phage tail tape measure protein